MEKITEKKDSFYKVRNFISRNLEIFFQTIFSLTKK
jgi:hypothetical protein